MKQPMFKYLRTYKQDRVMLWVWRVVMVCALLNGLLAAFREEWRTALTEFVIAAFVLRITTLEQYITECNALRKAAAKQHPTPPTDGFGA